MKFQNIPAALYIVLFVVTVALGLGFTSKSKGSALVKTVAVQEAGVRESITNEAPSLPTLALNKYLETFYSEAGLAQKGLPLTVFRDAVVGYHNMMSAGLLSKEKPLVTVIDFNQSSKKRRLWVIDMEAREVLYNTLVAHGRGSGGEYATAFSNIEGSNQSSLGFYLTQGTYQGKNGLSLKLEGLDDHFNSNASERFVVVHGASYVSESFIDTNGRLGRSQGCPALPLEFTKPIIDTIKNQTLLYIDGPSSTYSSRLLNLDQAAVCFVAGKEKSFHSFS
ncbi:murein L,D-transpeptidase catalytic domain family protein [Pontibacter actiniarum]|uniref:Murein L,D-transpeptidase catalytic domain family protein n=1 Tax=Pontibacter actiniarum TaxID=323450 RepID=A0A1X9YZ12_9BACT|nr:murein L,D-transpeptidase catalytic domain family protein [Pontibacter actiniarum]ARS38099.1 hypothetical protein CA264_21370 [Pontibacter actiniarum]